MRASVQLPELARLRCTPYVRPYEQPGQRHPAAKACTPRHMHAGDRVALLVNNLGSTTPLEMHGAAAAAARLVHTQLKVSGSSGWLQGTPECRQRL